MTWRPAKPRDVDRDDDGSVGCRLTRNTATSPVASSHVALASTVSTSPYAAVSCLAPLGSTRSEVPRASRAVWAKGWKIVCRQAGAVLLACGSAR